MIYQVYGMNDRFKKTWVNDKVQLPLPMIFLIHLRTWNLI